MSADTDDRILGKLFEPIATGSTMQDTGLRATLLEQYKLYVEMANAVSTRRERANAFALSMNTGVVVLIGYSQTRESLPVAPNTFWIVAIAGIVLNWVWYRTLRSYRDLSTAKFKVIHRIERQLVISPFDAEWEAVQRGANPALYRPLTHVENWVPRVFCALYSVVLIQLLPWRALWNLVAPS